LILRCYAVLASVSRCYSTLEGRLVTCYSPGRHFTQGLLPFLVRLACVRHAASVDSEPGSNSRLKPDVCRRVVGRLPSPHIQSRLQKLLWVNNAGWRHHSASCSPDLDPKIETRKSLKTMVVYLVRSLGLMPESVSHDWHVQPSCQRPNRGPPERREFSPGDLAVRRNRLSSKLYKHTARGESRQSALPTEFPDDFHIGKSVRSGGGRAASDSRFLTIKPFGMTRLLVGGLRRALFARNSMAFRSG
jgi:hypothetical protein